ncbi:MAG: RS21-C6 protein [Candidatus Omnitrophica bacterium]|nr:RS21-C6 protein [Candidatus Omnitrophota bacterium]
MLRKPLPILYNTTMAQVPEHPSLSDIQRYVRDICRERGWDKDGYLEKILLMTEEYGELVKAIRRQAGLYREQGGQSPAPETLAEEFADVLSYLCDLANYFNIDLETAFRAKERRNSERRWEK